VQRPMDRAEADGPSKGVDEHGCNSRVGGRLVPRVDKQGHVYGHVDMSDALESESCEHAATAPENINKTPREH
jgi:hypothetical protein